MCPKCGGQIMADNEDPYCFQCGHRVYAGVLSMAVAGAECRDPHSIARAIIDKRYQRKLKARRRHELSIAR